jgi:hypothetical protein
MARNLRASMDLWLSFSSPSSSSLAGRCCRWSLRCYSTTSQPPVPLPSPRPPFLVFALARQTALAHEAFRVLLMRRALLSRHPLGVLARSNCDLSLARALSLVRSRSRSRRRLSRSRSRSGSLARAPFSLSLSPPLDLLPAVPASPFPSSRLSLSYDGCGDGMQRTWRRRDRPASVRRKRGER